MSDIYDPDNLIEAYRSITRLPLSYLIGSMNVIETPPFNNCDEHKCCKASDLEIEVVKAE